MEREKAPELFREEDFEKFFKENEKTAFSFAYSILMNREDAKDAVQEGFMKFYKARNRLDANRNLKAYLFQIVKNVCFDILNSRKNTEEIENIPLKEINNRIESMDRKKIIKEAMKILNRQERMVISLLTFEGFSSKEVGEIMNISDSTVRNHFMNGRNKIKNFIIKNYPDYARAL
ncbi:RNA polymerase sigma-70 factor, ECF subfamily [Thermotomaculum hydrothermale]|uniref:RNA polymerase sigma-70 factor, ECF subfamily n=1 Tax=Thermotomaculum hydrothermale TaxID=981385 RepID=A0A7R6SZA6_9BACT|nr:sigma-70 family RNA polymerase sigma factor [Thermotomaculum hydrothermale]BBB32625.1 RNA polymerase sigma-70 factor, ECF subfamily [Thermotomaculum hydrothermale]